MPQPPLLFQEGRALAIEAAGSIGSAAVGLAKRRSDMVFAEIRSDSPDSFDYDSRNTELSGDSTDCVARASIFCLLSITHRTDVRMNFRDIKVLYCREVRSALRDRTIVTNSILLPIFLYPVLMWLVYTGITFISGQNEELR